MLFSHLFKNSENGSGRGGEGSGIEKVKVTMYNKTVTNFPENEIMQT
jgi:hypothetical protein